MTTLSRWLSGLLTFIGSTGVAGALEDVGAHPPRLPSADRDSSLYTRAIRLRNTLRQGAGWMLVGHRSHSSHSSHASHASHYSGSSSSGTYVPAPSSAAPTTSGGPEQAPSSTTGSSPSAGPASGASTLTPQQRRERGISAEPTKQAAPSAAAADQSAVAAAEVAKLIMRIQLALNSRGYCNCAVDGKFGQGTQLALKKYQKDNGLKVSGLPDTETLKMLDVAF